MAERILGYNVDQLNNTARRVQSLSNDADNTIKDAEATLEHLRTVWTGTVSDTLTQKIEEEIALVKKDLERFKNVGTNLEGQAKSLSNLDEEHKSSINSVTY